MAALERGCTERSSCSRPGHLSAGLAVRLGFWLDSWAVRTVGLAVAGLAAAKIALFDLSRLEALYRVGSFFVLALIARAVAYAYNRRVRQTAAAGSPSATENPTDSGGMPEEGLEPPTRGL